MLTRTLRLLLPAGRRRAFDDWALRRRWRLGIRMDASPEVNARFLADGYRYVWRISRDVAIGHTLDGRVVTIPVDAFVSRYLVGAQ
ncbi:hypothetical protein F0U44_20885 [Nocardioides humilatus]|uniref:Uncharacterized protein n=1 Tax=Nocardioides humilatus TaxID=2607660 RepID=A0A5B1L6Z7_9ACTN|nr:hypothetical protein [Nocardioides humilatus]KAA1415447.1 hypothetical protein F0U44_20885 [Nocardioides humilatus]